MRFFFLIFLLSACGEAELNNTIVDAGSEDEDIEAYPIVSFEDQIVPILRNSCILSGCHGENGVSVFLVPKGLDANPEEIKRGLDGVASGRTDKLLIAPGEPSQSEILVRILAEQSAMPPLSTLPVEQINDLNFWVAQGANYD